MVRTLAGKLKTFACANQAVAAVEFALILPILLLVYFGSIETSQLIIADRRVTTVAGTLGDLVARSKDSITSSALDNYFGAASSTMGPMTTSGLTQVVSLLRVNSAGTATVVWSRAYPAGTPARASNSTFDMTGSENMNLLARGKDLVVSEANYTYRPMLDLILHSAIPLSHTNYYLPRFEGTITCC